MVVIFHLSDKGEECHISTIAVLMGEDKTVVTRGCTALADENHYKCDMHTAGNQVDFEISSRYFLSLQRFSPSAIFPPDQKPFAHLFFRFSPSATAMEVAATKIGTLQERQVHWR